MFLLYPALAVVCSKIRCMHIKRVTPLEIVAGVALVAVIGALAWSQTLVFAARDRDMVRKTDINAINNYLQYVYRPTHSYYPPQLDPSTLATLDTKYLTGPSHFLINSHQSSLRYDPLNCTNGQCQGYILRANLEQEADFIKEQL